MQDSQISQEQDPLQYAKVTDTDDTTQEEEGIALGAGIDFSDPDSPLAKYYLQNSHLVLVLVLGLVYIFMNFIPLWHTDIWGHLKYGQWMSENLQIPAENPFHFHAGDPTPFYSLAWLSQAGLYQLYSLGEFIAGGEEVRQLRGGIEVLRFCHATVVLLWLMGLVAAYRYRSESLSLGLIGIGVLLILNGAGMAVFRPQLFGQLCFSGLLFLLCTKNFTWSRVGIIGLLFVLWVNLHGSYGIGLAFLGLYFLGTLLDISLKHKTWAPRILWQQPFVRLLGISFLVSFCGVALLNPAGPFVFWQTVAMAKNPVVLLMDEWQPMTISLRLGAFWSYSASILLLIGSYFYLRRLPSLTAVLIFLVIGLQPLFFQRSLIWWLMVLPWILLPVWKDKFSDVTMDWSESIPSFRKTLAALAMILLVAIWTIPVQWILSGQPAHLEQSLSQGTPYRLAFELQGQGTKEEPWLPELTPWLQKHYPDGYRGRIFTTETSGDFLLWTQPKKCQVFMFSHVHSFPLEHWKLCAAVRFGHPSWEKILNAYHVNLVVVEAGLNPRLRDNLTKDPDWEIILDETGDPSKVDWKCRLLIAVRRNPIN